MAVTTAMRGLGRLSIDSTALFLCDMQEKFRPMIAHFDKIVHNSNRVLQAAKILNLPVFATEQYPKGLGHTVKELGLEEHGIKPFEKTQFSMVLPELMEEFRSSKSKSVLLCGIETHACIQHTTLDLIDSGFDVHVLVDCCSSRSMTDRIFAFRRMRDMGAFLTTSESVILGLPANSAHPNFRQLQKIVFQSAPDTGLVNNDL